MTQAIALLIRDVAVDSGMFDVGFRNNYSGRGMYGRKCVGITGSEQECQQVIAAVIKEAHSRADQDDLEFDDVVDAVLDFSKDSMGFDMILYWPNIEPVADEEPVHDGQPDEAQEWHDFDPDC
jgi:hypothetical protein